MAEQYGFRLLDAAQIEQMSETAREDVDRPDGVRAVDWTSWDILNLIATYRALRSELEAERSGRRGFTDDEVLAVGQLMARVAELGAALQAERERNRQHELVLSVLCEYDDALAAKIYKLAEEREELQRSEPNEDNPEMHKT